MRVRIAMIGVAALLLGILILLVYPIFYLDGGPRPVDPLLSRMHTLYVATIMYASDNQGYLPDMRTPAGFRAALFPEYLHDPAYFINPHTPGPIVPNRRLSGRKLGSLGATTPPVLLYAASGNTDKPMAAVRSDGTARRYSPEEWRDLSRGPNGP